MCDSAFGYDDSMQPRFAEMDLSNLFDDVEIAKQYVFFVANAGGGMFGTARDYARFSQMLANGGTLDGQRILGRAAVGQMMHNQIPGIPVEFSGREFRGNWGYGLMLFDEQGWPWFHGGLLAAGCVSHSGAGGPSFWVDREQGVVGVYFATCLDMDANTGDLRWDFDLFQNLVTAAVID
jgi:CubicO group peptidase (beta-lactamase class C family)